MADWIIYGVIAAITTAYLVLNSQKCLQILQLEGYKLKGYLRWMGKDNRVYLLRLFCLSFLITISQFVYLMLFGQYAYFGYIGFLAYIILSQLFFNIYRKEEKKTPLKYTGRVKRIIVLSTVLFAGLVFLATYFTKDYKMDYMLTGVLPVCIPFVIAVSAVLLKPYERLCYNRFKRKARKKLDAKPDLQIIGITGSYGKTSVRSILTELLKTTYKTGSTIHSYNTPMGICRLINDPAETLDYQYFVAEMGARHVGDIAELASFLRPQIGVLTGVGNQHLETFGSAENIAAEKYRLIEALPQQGLAAFNCSCAALQPFYEQAACNKINVGRKGAGSYFASYSEVRCTADGSTFVVDIDGKTLRFATKLLGEHNVSNVTLCIALAYKLGVPLAAMEPAVKALEPVPHRLQLLQAAEDITVIDDAYNSNIDGAKTALDVLSRFEGKKIMVTPGIVELGKESAAVNRELGTCAARVCDHLYLIGKNAPAIREGAIEAGMAEQRIRQVAGLQEAVAATSETAGKKVILFENDLPDNL